jgi:hypothetical protein
MARWRAGIVPRCAPGQNLATRQVATWPIRNVYNVYNIHVPNWRRVILLHVSNCKTIYNFLIKIKNYMYKYINPNPTLSVRIYYTIYVHKL